MKLDPRWWSAQGDYFKEHTLFWLEILGEENSAPDLVLDLGCGPGRFTVLLAKRSKLVIAVDVNREMLMLVKAKRDQLGLSDRIFPVLGDVQNLPFQDGCADMINSMGTLVHVPNQQDAINEIHRVVEPGGSIIVDQTNPLSLEFLWEAFKTLFASILFRKRRKQKIFVKTCNLWEFKNLFRQGGLSIEKVKGFQVIPFLPVFGFSNDAYFLTPLRLTSWLDRLVRKLPLAFLAYNILITGKVKNENNN